MTKPLERVPVHGGELEYETRGEGDTVLLIHGSHIAGSFLPIMTEAGLANYRLIRYHRRGFAGSVPHGGAFSIEQQAADALAVLRHLSVSRAHVVGHSYGGTTALQLALQAPDIAGTLVLLEPALLMVRSAESFANELCGPCSRQVPSRGRRTRRRHLRPRDRRARVEGRGCSYRSRWAGTSRG